MNPHRPTMTLIALLTSTLWSPSASAFALSVEDEPSPPSTSKGSTECVVSELDIEVDVERKQALGDVDNDGEREQLWGQAAEVVFPLDGAPLQLHIRSLGGEQLEGEVRTEAGSTPLRWVREDAELVGDVARPSSGSVTLLVRLPASTADAVEPAEGKKKNKKKKRKKKKRKRKNKAKKKQKKANKQRKQQEDETEGSKDNTPLPVPKLVLKPKETCPEGTEPGL